VVDDRPCDVIARVSRVECCTLVDCHTNIVPVNPIDLTVNAASKEVSLTATLSEAELSQCDTWRFHVMLMGANTGFHNPETSSIILSAAGPSCPVYEAPPLKEGWWKDRIYQ